MPRASSFEQIASHRARCALSSHSPTHLHGTTPWERNESFKFKSLRVDELETLKPLSQNESRALN